MIGGIHPEAHRFANTPAPAPACGPVSYIIVQFFLQLSIITSSFLQSIPSIYNCTVFPSVDVHYLPLSLPTFSPLQVSI